jgi:hypothetical protein
VARKKAAHMRFILSVSLLMLAPLSLGCLSTPRPQPIVKSTPADKSRDVAIDPPRASDSVGQTVADTSSSAGLSSRVSKFFSRPDSSDRMPLPRSDQSLENDGGPAQWDIGRDF